VEEGGLNCVKCPTGTDCSEKGVTLTSIQTVPGYWRISNSSLNYYKCRVEAFCLGGDVADCKGNRAGPLCALWYTFFALSTDACGQPHNSNN
jgi:hypothetical protein